jgi:hypothetical protein
VVLIGGLFLALLGILVTAISRQLADEFKAWTPWLIGHIIRRAVCQLPENERERFAEEWQSHVDDPGRYWEANCQFWFFISFSENGPHLLRAH